MTAKAVELPYTKLIMVRPYADGMHLWVSGRKSVTVLQPEASAATHDDPLSVINQTEHGDGGDRRLKPSADHRPRVNCVP